MSQFFNDYALDDSCFFLDAGCGSGMTKIFRICHPALACPPLEGMRDPYNFSMIHCLIENSL